jgi:hypothetical protein
VFAPAANRNGYSMCGLRGTLVSRRSRPGTACRGANGATARAPSTNTRPGEHEKAVLCSHAAALRMQCRFGDAVQLRAVGGREKHSPGGRFDARNLREHDPASVLQSKFHRIGTDYLSVAHGSPSKNGSHFPVPDDVWKQRAFRVTTNAPYLLASRRAALPVRCFGHARGGVVAFATGQHAA